MRGFAIFHLPSAIFPLIRCKIGRRDRSQSLTRSYSAGQRV